MTRKVKPMIPVKNYEKEFKRPDEVETNEIVIFMDGSSVFQLCELRNPDNDNDEKLWWAFKRVNSPWGEYRFYNKDRSKTILDAINHKFDVYIVDYQDWTYATEYAFQMIESGIS